MYNAIMNELNKSTYEALAGEYEEQQEVLRNENLVAPYITGAKFLDRLRAWSKENLPEDLHKAWLVEAAVEYHFNGGQPSQTYNRQIFKAVNAYKTGDVYETPYTKMNEEEIERDKKRRDMGLIYEGIAEHEDFIDEHEEHALRVGEANIRAKDERRRSMAEMGDY